MRSPALCRPACLHVPDGAAGTYGDDVAEVAEQIGRPLQPEQKLAVDALVAHDARGRFLSIEAGVEGPRQTVGKTGGIMLPVLLWTALTDPDHITWTAHLAETAQRSFAEVAGADPDDESSLIATCDWLRRRVRTISYENGAEAVRFRNGAEITWRIRSKMRGRGLSGNTVFNDEYLFATSEQTGAQLPVLATRSMWGNARAYLASSAAKAESHELRRVRARALAGDQSLTYVGWWAAGGWDDPGCERGRDCSHEVGAPGCVLDDEDLWATCNPLLGRLVSVDFLRSMRRTLLPIEFGREFCGWQEKAAGAAAAPINRELWASRRDRGSRRASGSMVAMGIDVARDRSSAAIGWVGRREDGRQHWEVVRVGRGTGWVPAAAAELVAKMPLAQAEVKPGVFRPAIAGDGLAMKPLLPALAQVGIDPILLGASDIAAACTGVVDDVDEDGARHLGQEQLDRAVEAAVRRDVGDGGMAFGKKLTAADITPLYAVTVARYVFLQSESSREVIPLVAFR